MGFRGLDINSSIICVHRCSYVVLTKRKEKSPKQSDNDNMAIKLFACFKLAHSAWLKSKKSAIKCQNNIFCKHNTFEVHACGTYIHPFFRFYSLCVVKFLHLINFFGRSFIFLWILQNKSQLSSTNVSTYFYVDSYSAWCRGRESTMKTTGHRSRALLWR